MSSNYFNYIIKSPLQIHTLILTSPSDCINYKDIENKLISEGYTIMPTYSLFPNSVHISYYNDKEMTMDNETILSNIIISKNGFIGNTFM